MLHLDSFDCSGAKFDFPPAGFYSNDGGDSGGKTPCAPPVDLAPLADGDQTFSFWPDSSTPSDHSPFPCDYTPPSSITSYSQDPCPDVNQNELPWALANSEPKDVGMEVEDDRSSEEPSTDLSGGDPRPLDPHTTRMESTQPRSVRSFFKLASLEYLMLMVFADENRLPQAGPTARYSRSSRSRHLKACTSGTSKFRSWQLIWACRAGPLAGTSSHSSSMSPL